MRLALKLIVGAAPIAAIGSLLASLFHLGGWGWLLFLWFGFVGYFSLGLLRHTGIETWSRSLYLGVTSALIALFVGGVAFGLSDLPQRLSPVLFSFALPLAVILIAVAYRALRAERPAKDQLLEEFAREIQGWPPAEAKLALLVVQAAVKGDMVSFNRMYPDLRAYQLEAVGRVIKQIGERP